MFVKALYPSFPVMKSLVPVLRLKNIFALAVLLMPLPSSGAADPKEVTIIDARHYSNVFGETRNYRIFLPPGYAENSGKRYPVIYFYHGWSQRYFGSSNPYGDFDKGDDNGGDNIARFVSGHDVIVVKPDGYNRSADEEYYVRPYNVSPVETYRQFPLYFPELVEHVDSHYRTIADREHRGIAGLSMGGFMTFWIGGKYPHLLSAAGNFCGSPEFLAGPKDFPVELRHLDFYNNYGGMNVRLHYGDKDFIRGYHQDLNRVWPQVIDNYDYKVFDAAHSTCGLGEMLSFILETFESPPARPAKWGHIDVYPKFSVWDYEVKTDRTVPGFTILEEVDKRGFRVSVREFLPDGALIPSVNVSVTTPPLYEKDQLYTINDLNTATSQISQRTLRSDEHGRLTIELTGSVHEVGINKTNDKPNITLAGIALQGGRWATHKKDIAIKISVFNKGLAPGKNITATLSATRPSALVKKAEIALGDLAVNDLKTARATMVFRVEGDSIEIEKFKITFRDENENEWSEFFEIPLKKTLPEIKDFEIADGKVFTVAKSGTDSVTTMLGNGNGDGVANPGESIVILVKDQKKFWRTDLTGQDPYINPFGINIRESDNWSSLDHVGASAKYDVPVISSDCPQGHTVEFIAEYWLPQYPLHIIRQGIVRLQVKGKDTTPPVIGRVYVTGDNILHVKIYDGSTVRRVKAILTDVNDPKRSVEAILTDDGRQGDRVENDLLFSSGIPHQSFGIFRIVIEAEDSSGNKTVTERDERFALH